MYQLRSFWKEINDPSNFWRNLIWFVTALIIAAQVDDFLTWLGSDVLSSPIVRIAVVLLVVVLSWRVYRYLRRSRSIVYKEIEPSPAKSALIVFVSASRSKTPAETAIEKQKALGKLRFCILLYTADSDPNTTAIMQNHPPTTDFLIVPKRIEDDRNPAHVYEKVREAIRDASAHASSSDDILVDFTGGTKLATFAMAMAAQDASTSVQYIYTPFNRETRSLEFGRSVPMLLDSLSGRTLDESTTAPVPVK